MKKMLSLVLVVIGTVFAVSCGGNSGAATDKNDAAMTSAAVTVDDLVGKEFAITNMYEGKEVTIAFPATNMIGGKSAVNSYFTEFTLNGDKIAFKALGSSGNSRIDFLIDSDKNKVYINEINSIPGSLAFYLWEAKGIDFSSVLDEMIRIGVKDYKKRVSKTHSFETNILQGFANFGGVKGLKGVKGKLR